jgi:hypothetical protein
MERRRAVIAAATVSLTLLAGAAVVALSSGIVGASEGDGPGHVSPIDTATTVTLDQPVSQAPASAVTGDDDPSTYDDEGDDGGVDRDHAVADEHEFEYQGADDDD